MSGHVRRDPAPTRTYSADELQLALAGAARRWRRRLFVGSAACSIVAAAIAAAPRPPEPGGASLRESDAPEQTPARVLRPRIFGMADPGSEPAGLQLASTEHRQAWATGESTASYDASSPTWPYQAPTAAKRETSSWASYRAQLREEVLRQLHALGIAPSSGSRELSDAQLDLVAAGQAAAGGAPGGGGPATDSADPELTALNRVLVEKGGLLLRPWSVELQPEVSYSYKGSNGLLIVDDNGRRTAVAHDVDLNRLETALIGRLGLPWQSQAELKVPYVYAQEDSSSGAQTDSRSQSGLGDVELALTRQFVRESGWLPDLLVEGRWKTSTGKDAFDGGGDTLPLGTGFNGLGARVTAVKTVEPLVLLGTAGYTVNLEGNREGFEIDPGDQWLGSVGAVLAAGPGVSLRGGFSVGFSDEATVDGDRVAGSDRVDGRLNFGVGATLTDKVLLDLGFGVGVTDDAPDFTTRAGLAYRF
jgi:hypothetical protein